MDLSPKNIANFSTEFLLALQNDAKETLKKIESEINIRLKKGEEELILMRQRENGIKKPPVVTMSTEPEVRMRKKRVVSEETRKKLRNAGRIRWGKEPVEENK